MATIAQLGTRRDRSVIPQTCSAGPLLRSWQWLYRRTPDFRGKGKMLWHWPARLFSSWPTNIAVTSLDGYVFPHCDLNEYLNQALFFCGLPELDVDWMGKRLLKPGDVFIDIGACYGYHALTCARRVGSQGRVYAFEPQLDMFAALQENARYNGLATVEAENLALSDRSECLQLYRFSDLGVGHTSIATLGHAVSQVLTCPAITLDEYLARRGINHVTLIKLDAEGSELKILRGAQAVLRTPHPPMWIVEVNMTTAQACGYHPRDVFSFLANFGYRAYKPLWSKVIRKVRQLQPCQAERMEHGQNLLYAVPSAHGDALARVGVA